MSSCGGPCRRAFLKPFALAAQPCRLRPSGRCPMGRKSVFEPVASDGCMTDSFRRPCIGKKPDEKSQKPYSVKPPVRFGAFVSILRGGGGQQTPWAAGPFADRNLRHARRVGCRSLRKNGGGGLQRIPVFRILSGDRTLPDGRRMGPEQSFDGTLSGSGRGAACRRPGADRRCGTGNRGRSRAVQDQDIFLSSLAVGFPADFNVCRPTF